MEKELTPEELVSKLKSMGVTCRSCWWQEGGMCYVKPCEREESGRSKKPANEICEQHTSKRNVLGPLFGDKLVIASEEKEKAKGNNTGNY